MIQFSYSGRGNLFLPFTLLGNSKRCAAISREGFLPVKSLRTLWLSNLSKDCFFFTVEEHSDKCCN